MRLLVLAAIVSALAAVPLRAETKEIADLFPGDSIAYLEVSRPGEFGKELSAFLKGSVLAKSGSPLNLLRDLVVGREPIDSSPSGLLSTLLGPEMLKESARFKGLAAALTGFNSSGRPEFVAVVLPGDSQLPGFVLRSYLAGNTEFRKIAAVEGIDLQQESSNLIVDDPLAPNGEPAMPARHFFGPVFGQGPGFIVIGSNKELVAATIRRFHGKEKSATLAARASFQSLKEQRSKPGLMFHADARTLYEHLLLLGRQQGAEAFEWAAIRRLLPQRTVRALTARLDVKDQALALTCSLTLEGPVTAPLADLLSGQKAVLSDLQAVRGDLPLGLTLRLPEGRQRRDLFLAVLDALIRATGTLGPSASEIAQDLEERRLITHALLGKIESVTLTLPPTATWPKIGLPAPVLLVRCDSAETAETFASAVPAVLQLLANEDDAGGIRADAVIETIAGVKIRSLEAKASPLKTPFHFGRRDNVVGIGMERRFLAECLRADPARSVTALASVADALKGTDRPAAIGIWNWSVVGSSALGPKSASARFPSESVRISREIDGPFLTTLDRSGAGLVPREFFLALKGMPPMVATLGRQGNELRFQIQQHDPNNNRLKAIDRWVEHLASPSDRYGYSRSRYFQSVDAPVMVPPPFFPPPPPVPGP